MKLPELEAALEKVQKQLESHDRMKPFAGPRGMPTDAFKAWQKTLTEQRAERDRLMGLIDAEEKLLANKPFAPVPPSGDPAPVEEGPADHLAGTVPELPPPPVTDFRDEIVSALDDIERLRANNCLVEIVISQNVVTCTITKPGETITSGVTGEQLAPVIRRAARIAEA